MYSVFLHCSRLALDSSVMYGARPNTEHGRVWACLIAAPDGVQHLGLSLCVCVLGDVTSYADSLCSCPGSLHDYPALLSYVAIYAIGKCTAPRVSGRKSGTVQQPASDLTNN